MTDQKPRQVAERLIKQFIEGGQVQVEQAKGNGLAIAHARNTAAMIVFHARKAREEPDYHYYLLNRAGEKKRSPGRSLAQMALRYNETRSRRATA